jgi:hypothetical protein
MGNRAVVVFADDQGPKPVGVYLHWNGGPESVYAFLDFMKERKLFHDSSYATARLAQVAANFFGGNCSVGIVGVNPNEIGACSPGDNGIYVVKLDEGYEAAGYTVERWSGYPEARKWPEVKVKKEAEEARKHAYRQPHPEDGHTIMTRLAELSPRAGGDT